MSAWVDWVTSPPLIFYSKVIKVYSQYTNFIEQGHVEILWLQNSEPCDWVDVFTAAMVDSIAELLWFWVFCTESAHHCVEMSGIEIDFPGEITKHSRIDSSTLECSGVLGFAPVLKWLVHSWLNGCVLVSASPFGKTLVNIRKSDSADSTHYLQHMDASGSRSELLSNI